MNQISTLNLWITHVTAIHYIIIIISKHHVTSSEFDRLSSGEEKKMKVLFSLLHEQIGE